MHDFDTYTMNQRHAELREAADHAVLVREARRGQGRSPSSGARPLRALAGLLGLRGDARRSLKGRRSLA